MGGILHRPHGHRVKAVALRLAFQEAPYHRKLMPIVKDMEQLLALEFDRIVGLMVARVTLLRFDEEFDDIVSSGLATAKFDTLFESAVSSGYSGIKIATPTVDDVMAEQKLWGSALVKGVLGESAAQLNDIISEGIKAGKAREQIVNDLYQTRADDGILPEWRARLIAQTEVIRSYNAGSLAEKADTGVEYVRWLDGQRGACESCSHLEGVTIPMEPGKLKSQQNYFVDQLRGFVVQHPPLHPGCRCTIVGATAEEYLGQPNFDSLTYSTVPLVGSAGAGGIGAARTITERPLPRALPTIPTIPTTPSAKPVEKVPEPVSLPVTSPAVDAFRDWYAEHGAGMTGIEAMRAYAKYTGKPMKVLSDAIKTEGYEIKTLIATPRTDVLPGATAVKITPPGTFKKKVEPSAGKKAEEGLGKPGEINVQPNYIDRLSKPSTSEVTQIENTLRKVMADAKLSMRIPSGVISKILDDGRFKSQFETNTSHGSLSPSSRAKAETNMFGYPNNLPPAQRPVYGYLSPSGDDHNGPKHYGDIKAVFKDELKSRATFTYADSLGPGIGKQEVAPSLVSDPKWYSAGQYNWHESNLKNIRPYPEVQYHGGLSIDDIDYVLLPQPMLTVETQLKQKGITYYIDPELRTR